MATKYVCDRCRKETERDEEITSVSIPVYTQYQPEMDSWPRKSVDLCGSCIRALNEFVKPLPKEAKQ